MTVNDLLDVVHATVADLYCVAGEDFSEFVVFVEMFINEVEESVSDVGGDVFAEWGVIPKYVAPFSVFSCGPRSWFVV